MSLPATRRILLPRPLAHQVVVLRDGARHKVVVCGRRWGKTIAGLLAVIEGHGPRRGTFPGALDGATIWWVAPSFPMAQLIWRDLKKALRGAWTEKKEKEFRITLPGGGSVTVKSADDPDALRGVGLDGVVLDEAAFMGEAAWVNGIRPALSDRQGWAIFLSTPAGLNWFHRLYERAEDAPGWQRWRRPTSDNPKIPPEEMEAARRDMGPLHFAQEHLAEFVVAGAGLFRPEWLEHRYDPVGDSHYRLEGGELVARDRLLRFAVVDLAVSTKTTADYTVILVCGRAPDGRLLLLDLDRARREGPDIVPALQTIEGRWHLAAVWVERTAFQLALVQEARRAGLPVRELRPDRDKVSRALPATAALEGGRVLLPRAARWVDEFEAEVLAFPVGAHDDQVDCLAYAVEVHRHAFAWRPAVVAGTPKQARASGSIFRVTSLAERAERERGRRRRLRILRA